MAHSVRSRSVAAVATWSAPLPGLLLADMVRLHVIGHVSVMVERLQSIIMRFFGRVMMLGSLGLIDNTRTWVNHDIVIGVRGLLSDTMDVAHLILELDSAVLYVSSVLDIDETDRANTLVELLFLRLIATRAHHEIHSFVSANHAAA